MTGRKKATPAPPPDGATAWGPGEPLAGSDRPHPPVGVGLWALGRWDAEAEERTRRSIDQALEQNLPWFDTAEVYGNGRSERLLGDALARRSSVGAARPFVSTKVSWEHLTASQVRAAMTGSLHRLGTASVDVYLVHAPDPHRPIAETMGAMEALADEGKARAIGVSNFAVDEMEAAESVLARHRLAVNQIRCNLLDLDEARPVLEYARARGIVVQAYSPLARGLLAGRYLAGGKVPPEVRRFALRPLGKDAFPAALERARAIERLAGKAGVPMASIALHGLRRLGAVPVVGTSRPEQVDALVAAWRVRPPDDVLDRADEIAREPT